MKPAIVVIGSSNTDMVIQTDHIPVPGETILGGKFFMNPGGKGANQAVAAARLGGNVIFICKTGNDVFGQQSTELFKKENINTSYLLSDTVHPSGVALITVDKHGENTIAVASGSNGHLFPEDLKAAENIISQAAFVLIQLEIPLETVEHVASLAKAKNVRLILNPAPARELPDTLLKKISIITPNETEAEKLTGIAVTDKASAEKAAKILNRKGIKTVILTRGAEGAMIVQDETVTSIPSLAVDAVDTTAAGDVFNGALAVALAEGKDLVAAITFACRAAAISVTRLGAQASAPYRSELD